MIKGFLYLLGFIFVVLLIIGNTAALTIFFAAILVLCIGQAIIEKHEKRKS